MTRYRLVHYEDDHNGQWFRLEREARYFFGIVREWKSVTIMLNRPEDFEMEARKDMKSREPFQPLPIRYLTLS